MAPLPLLPVRKKRGCLGCGCAILVLIVILLLALAVGGSYFAYTSIRGYTDSTGMAIAQFNGGDKVFQTARQKLDFFSEAVKHGRPDSLRLNADEINTLIARDPSFAGVKGHVFIALKDNEALLQTSLPLGAIESVMWTDRYLNGDATFALNFDSGEKEIDLRLRALQIKNHDLPADFDASFNQGFNRLLNQKIQADPATRDFFNRVRTMTVQNGELVIEIR